MAQLEVGQAAMGLLLEGSSQKCWGVVFSSCWWFQWVPQLWELLQVSSLPEETIPAAELTQAGEARPGGD